MLPDLKGTYGVKHVIPHLENTISRNLIAARTATEFEHAPNNAKPRKQ